MPRARGTQQRRDRPLPTETMLQVQFTVPEAAFDRFRLLYPRKGAFRVMVNAALRACIERPDLCQFLTRSYGPESFRTQRGYRHASQPKLEHPLRTISSDPFPLQPAPPDGPSDATSLAQDPADGDA